MKEFTKTKGGRFMAVLLCLPDGALRIERLQSRLEILLALSRIFVAGGENLVYTLPELERAYSRWLKEEEESEGKELQSLLQADYGRKDLVYEFNRLFVGPKAPPVPPYESVYLSKDRLVMQESTLDVRRWYRQEELMPVSRSNEPDDFIATELEFGAYLLARAADYVKEQQRGKAIAFLDAYNAFYDEHLVWLEEFVRCLKKATQEKVFLIIGTIILKTVRPIEYQKGGLT